LLVGSHESGVARVRVVCALGALIQPIAREWLDLEKSVPSCSKR
jgi:hypothetical protein